MRRNQLVGRMVLVVGVLAVLWGVIVIRVDDGKQVLAEKTSLSLEERVVALEKRVAGLEKKTSVVSKKAGTEKESFLRLMEGVAAGSNWTTVVGTEFWLNQELYGNVKKITWEGWLKVQDGNGVGMARLYDVTNNRAVDFSEVKVTGEGRISFYSPVLAIWRGQNQYRIEVRSSTGYPVTISEARLRIVTQ